MLNKGPFPLVCSCTCGPLVKPKWTTLKCPPDTPAHSGWMKMGRWTILNRFNILLPLNTPAHEWSARGQTTHEQTSGNRPYLDHYIRMGVWTVVRPWNKEDGRQLVRIRQGRWGQLSLGVREYQGFIQVTNDHPHHTTWLLTLCTF